MTTRRAVRTRTKKSASDRRSTAALAALVVLLIGSVAIGIVLGIPVLRQYPAEISAPDEIAGLARLRDGATQEATDRMARQVVRQTKAPAAVVAGYASPSDPAHRVIVMGASRFVFDLDQNLEDLPAALNGYGYTFTEFHPVPAGPLGGVARCGSGAVASGVDENTPVSLCQWVDHGSIGGAVFFNRPVDDAARLFLTIRAAVSRRV